MLLSFNKLFIFIPGTFNDDSIKIISDKEMNADGPDLRFT